MERLLQEEHCSGFTHRNDGIYNPQMKDSINIRWDNLVYDVVLPIFYPQKWATLG